MKIQQTPNRTFSCGCRHHAVLSIGMRRTDFQSADNVLYVHVMIIMSKAQTQVSFWPYFRLPPRCWLNLRSYSDSWPARMGPIRCPETSVKIATRCRVIPQKIADFIFLTSDSLQGGSIGVINTAMYCHLNPTLGNFRHYFIGFMISVFLNWRTPQQIL